MAKTAPPGGENWGESERKFWWTMVFVFVTWIYLTVSFARPITSFLRSHGFVYPAVYILAAIAGGWALYKVGRGASGANWSKVVWLAVTFIGLGLIVKYVMYSVEEAVHFIEYAALAMVILRAVSIDLRGPGGYVTAFILTALIGWGDEGIQYIAPSRYYDNWDVFYNALGGALGLLVANFLNTERERET